MSKFPLIAAKMHSHTFAESLLSKFPRLACIVLAVIVRVTSFGFLLPPSMAQLLTQVVTPYMS